MAENGMISQIQSLPALVRNEFDTLDERVRRLLDHNETLSVKRVVTTGCGDSHMAALATELAIESLSGIPVEPMTAMQLARYGAMYQPKSFPKNPLTLGISVSGTVSRTREALAMARAEGALTVAITANPDAPLAQTAEKMLDCTTAPFSDPVGGHIPGVRSYRVSMMVLTLMGIRLAEVHERLTQDEANALRRELKATADAMEATIERVNDRSRQLAEAVAEQNNFVFVGDGPNYATAIFGAAKLLEAAGRHAMGQETEEWHHLQYFVNADKATPTFMISPGGRGHSRMAEIVEPARRVGRTVIAVVPDGDQAIAPQVEWVLPVVGEVREIFSPMVYSIATELFSAHLSDVTGEPFFRNFDAEYNLDQPGVQTIQNSYVVGRDEI